MTQWERYLELAESDERYSERFGRAGDYANYCEAQNLIADDDEAWANAFFDGWNDYQNTDRGQP